MPAHNLLLGLHHVTATVEDAAADYRFYTQTLGLRLVKKTVNFDFNQVYHFYYGNEHGEPGTIFTTFPYAGHGVRKGLPGPGQVIITGFTVPVGSLDFWRRRLETAGFAASVGERFGRPTLRVVDPGGLTLELVEGSDGRAPWTRGGVGAGEAITGIDHVVVSVADAAETARFLNGVLGFITVAEEGPYLRLTAGGDGPGHYLDLRHDPHEMEGKNGLGTVHHVAWRVTDDEALAAVRDLLLARPELKPTEFRDRKYFHSVYCRMPGGVLFEFATIPPGFTVDEPLDALGQRLQLPEWEEPNRAAIERVLPKVEASSTADGRR